MGLNVFLIIIILIFFLCGFFWFGFPNRQTHFLELENEQLWQPVVIPVASRNSRCVIIEVWKTRDNQIRPRQGRASKASSPVETSDTCYSTTETSSPGSKKAFFER